MRKFTNFLIKAAMTKNKEANPAKKNFLKSSIKGMWRIQKEIRKINPSKLKRKSFGLTKKGKPLRRLGQKRPVLESHFQKKKNSTNYF